MTPERIDYYKEIHDIDWEEILPRLEYYAKGLLESRTWNGEYGGEVVEGKNASDIVHDAILKFLDGTRNYDKNRIDLMNALFGTIKSEIGNLATKKENRLTLRMSRFEKYGRDEIETAVFGHTERSKRNDSSSNLSPLEYKEQYEEILSIFLDDSLCQKIVRLIIEEDCTKPRCLSKRLEIDVQDIYKAMSRLRLKVNQIMKFKKIWRKK